MYYLSIFLTNGEEFKVGNFDTFKEAKDSADKTLEYNKTIFIEDENIAFCSSRILKIAIKKW